MKLRIPGWCKGASVKLNGEAVPLGTDNGYLTINRTWHKGDNITLDLPMPAERVYSNPHVVMNSGRVALKRGPFVYCIEGIDNPGGTAQRLRLPRGSALDETVRPGMFRGSVAALSAKAKAIRESDFPELYRNKPAAEEEAALTAIPYYLWANRGHGSMVLWIPES